MSHEEPMERYRRTRRLCEHFDELLLVRGDTVERRARTYRGMGRSFG